MKFDIKILIILVLITVLAVFLRFYKNTDNPPSLNIDEVAIGYNAWSILKTGKDEHGKFMPLSFKSVGDYKPPVLIYLTVPSIAIFGLNEFAVRFPAALISTILVPIFFLIVYNIFRNISLALISALLLAISPWHIYYSRYATESSIALAFVVTGIFFLYKLTQGRLVWSIPASFFFALSMYTYHTERLFVPLFILLFLFLYRKSFSNNKKKIVFFLGTLTLFVLPLLLSLIFGQDRVRAESTFITTDINFYRQVLVKDEIKNLSKDEYIPLFFWWVRKFMNYFQPSFLFYSGLNMTLPGTYGLGVLYLFELPLLALGLLGILKLKNNIKYLIFGWILLGILPASLTHNEQHSLRTLIILPALVIISSFGALTLFRFLQIQRFWFLKFSGHLFLGFIAWNLVFAITVFAIHFPKQRGEAFMEGTKQAVMFALANKDNYQEVIFDPVRGVEGPYIVSIPHMYILFYSAYDPKTYQNANQVREDGSFGFDKFTIKNIDWRKDQTRKATLFIGSPWSLPEKNIKEEEILKRIYLTGGQLAFLIVSPK